MFDNVIIIITALFSGIIATFITITWQKKAELKNNKLKIFTTLMSKRYDVAAEESVDALNMIDVVFYKSPKVRSAWKSFNAATSMSESDAKGQIIADKHLRLLEEIAEDIGYKDIRWDDIKEYYYPVGLSSKKNDEEMLRRAQLNIAMAQIEQGTDKENARQVSAQEDLNNQMMLKALENPEGFIKLIEAAGKMQQFPSSKK